MDEYKTPEHIPFFHRELSDEQAQAMAYEAECDRRNGRAAEYDQRVIEDMAF